MNLKNNKFKALALTAITGAIAALGSGCAATNEWAMQNQGNLTLLNSLTNLANATGSMMSGITGITGSVQDKKTADALEEQNKILQQQQRNNYRRPNYRPARPSRGGRGR